MEKLDTQKAFQNTNTTIIDSIKSFTTATAPMNTSQVIPRKRHLQKALTDDNTSNNVSPFRLNFRKSHTCGSLFAKCKCSTPSSTISLSSSSSSLNKSLLARSEGNNNNNTNTIFLINDNDDDDDDDVDENDVYYDTNDDVVDYDNNGFLTKQNYNKNFNKQFTSDSSTTISSVSIDKKISDNSTNTNTTTSTTSSIDVKNNFCSENKNITDSERKRSKKLIQSYSHPDTTFIFTDENKNPSSNPITIRSTSKTVTTKCGKVEIKHPKRLSSPNIGNYAILDVAVHPEVLLKISTKNVLCDYDNEDSRSHASFNSEKISLSPTLSFKSLNTISSAPSTTTESSDITNSTIRKQRPILKRSERKESTESDFSEYSVETLHNNSKIDSMTHCVSGLENIINSSDLKFSRSLQTNTKFDKKDLKLCSENNNESVKINENIDNLKHNAIVYQQLSTTTTTTKENTKNLDPAHKFFQESGILGPIIDKTSSANLIRRTSKIMQDPNFIEKIRKNSKLLRNSPEGRKGPYSNNSNDDLENIKIMTTNMRIDNSDNDDFLIDKVKILEKEISSLRDTINDRDSEIYKLKREIHKLKSVLQQTTNHIPIGNVSLQTQNNATTTKNSAVTMPTTEAIDCSKSSSAEDNCINHINNNGQVQYHDTWNNAVDNGSGSLLNDYDSETTTTTTDSVHNTTILCGNTNTNVGGIITSATGATVKNCGANVAAITSKCNQLHVPTPVVKKQGVSGESSDAANHQFNNTTIPKFEKDFRSKQLIKDAIMDNDFLKNIDSSQVRELVESMYSLEIAKGKYVIREGEAGSHLYVSAEGEFEVMKSGQTLGLMGPGKAFGELAILYNCTRTASIRVLCDAKVWVLDRRVFQQIMMRTGMQRIEENVNFLKSVPLLKNLSNDVLTKIADVLEVEFYPSGTYIIRQGASGDSFFLISQGSVKVTQKLPNSTEEKEIRILQRGDYFGEQALINEDKRTANIIALDPGVECLTLDRESFTHLIGNLCELKEKSYGDEGRIITTKIEEEAKEIFGKNIKQELQDIKLSDLEIVSTLGIGGFGRVELVKCYRDNQVQTFALKCLKKKHIIDTRQEEHVFSERTIMLSCNTPFICRLYRTFRDTKFVYMLLEACMGGEVWTILRDRGCFDENIAQFIIGCVLQAFEYLHSRGIIYRDLKPENLMLDERGYVKLVDFGFAKYIGHSNKTWTFCGTPEYVAPEIILNKGHDRAVDYWALGILMHELLNGTPPFTASDPMKTYNIILKGIDMIDFPKHMSRAAITLIKKLCRDVPAERLGYQKGGIQDIKKHKWFQGFDWDGLSNLTLIPPFLRPISHSLDTSYFDKFPVDTEMPPDENSGWDIEF